jgi:hypothetical protein
MPKRSSKKMRLPDPNTLAFAIVRHVAGETILPGAVALKPEEKNPAAVALGKLGGKKGGLARAKKLSAKRRIEIAAKAARIRWGTAKKKKPRA